MNTNDLYRSIGEVEDDLLLRTEAKTRYLHPVLRVAAASLVLILGIFGFSALFAPEAPEDTPTPWFIVTAQAADGEEVELDRNDGVLNSAFDPEDLAAGPSGSFFDPNASKSAPVFSFYLNPTEWASDATIGNASDYISLSVSYDGKEVDGRDKNVMIGFSLSKDIWRYWIVGRFEEPRDVTITITVRDAKSKEIIETIIVDVKYSADAQAYELSVVESQTFVEFK